MFIDNCLNRNVLELAVYDYKHDVATARDNLPHETYRYLAYRRFVRWIWKIVGRRNRRILPSCVVTRSGKVSHQRNSVDSNILNIQIIYQWSYLSQDANINTKAILIEQNNITV
ncbi:hypothetical protein KUTeg_017398, partial [Tegillarca granosa]